MAKILTFDDAISNATERPRLLLGNGFSIAWDYEAFSYGSLRKKADFSGMECDAETLFRELDTSDFEVVIERLRATDTIARLYDPSSPVAAQASKDSEVLRDALAHALASNHPDTTGSIPDEQYRSVRTFLANFSSVYSVNYDLLLYWATMKDGDELEVPRGDGFREDPEKPDADWVAWDMAQSWSQEIHYLHGALHLFDAGDRLKKLTWIRTGVALVDQIREQLAERSYPLVVTEGTSSDKKDKILHSAYLSKAFRSFSALRGREDLFIYGHSLADNDEHVLDAIARGWLRRIFVSVYGDPGSDENRGLIERAMLLPDRRASFVAETERRTARTLDVVFYDAASAQVWDRFSN
jgi:Domain of unknown function (DUF4917)